MGKDEIPEERRPVDLPEDTGQPGRNRQSLMNLKEAADRECGDRKRKIQRRAEELADRDEPAGEQDGRTGDSEGPGGN